MNFTWPWARARAKRSRIVWLDLGDLGDLVNPTGPHEQWQDHGLGLLRTILQQNGIETDLLSTRAVTTWDQLRKQLAGYDTLDHERAQLHLPGGAQVGANLQGGQSPRDGLDRRHARHGGRR